LGDLSFQGVEERGGEERRDWLEYRRLVWVRLREVCQGLGVSMTQSILSICLTSGAGVVISGYVVVSWFVGRSSQLVPFLLIMCLSLFNILTICEASHRATNKVINLKLKVG
jgi:hypothetical protein